MAFTVSTASKVMTERIEGILRTAFLRGSDQEAPVFNLFMKTKERTNELGRRIPIVTQPNASFGSIAEAGQLPLAGTPEIVQARIYYTNQFLTGEINKAVLDQETEANLMSFMRTPLDMDFKTFLEQLDQWCFGTGNGSLGVVSAVTTGASGTVTYGGDYGADNIKVNARHNFYSAAAAIHDQSAAVPVSTVVSKSGDVVTYDNVPTDVVATDTAHFYASYGRALHGIPYHVTDVSGDWLGLNTATYPALKATLLDAGATGGVGGTALTPGMIDLVQAKARKKIGASSPVNNRVMISHSAQEFNYRQLGYTTTYGVQRVLGMNAANVDFGIREASHNGMKWVLDDNCARSDIWGLHLPDWAIEYTRLPSFYDFDGDSSKKLYQKSGVGAPYDVLQYAVHARLDLVCKNRLNQWGIRNLPYVAGL